MLKSLVTIALALSTTTAMADSSRGLITQDLKCAGVSTTSGTKMEIKIASNSSGTEIVVDGFATHNLDNQLMASSEGSTYAQIVSRRINLILFGEALDQVLAGKADELKSELTGSISFLNGEEFELNCKGLLTSGK